MKTKVTMKAFDSILIYDSLVEQKLRIYLGTAKNIQEMVLDFLSFIRYTLQCEMEKRWLRSHVLAHARVNNTCSP